MAIGPEGDPSEYLDGEAFHHERRRVYNGPLGWAVNKEEGRMARVCYRAPHENLAETGTKRGGGLDWARWVFAEESGIAEGIFTAPLELIIDARLEPGAAIGLHWHHETEEVYYLLEGELNMTTVGGDGREQACALGAGDAHAVTLGQGHYGVAGPEGARFLAISVRAHGHPVIRLGFVLEDGGPSDAARLARGLAPHLRRLGHEVGTLLLAGERPAFPGHAALPDGTWLLAQAVAARARFDILLATSWRCCYAAAALPGAALAHLVLARDDGPLAARTYRDLPCLDAPTGVDTKRFTPPAHRPPGPLRVLAADDAALAIARRVTGIHAQLLGPVPLDALPAVLRGADALVAHGPFLALEMMACGGIAVTRDEAVATLARLRDDDGLRRRLGAEARATAEARDFATVAATFATRLRDLPVPSDVLRAELAAIGDLLRAPPPPRRLDDLADLGRRGVRAAARTLRRVAPRRAPQPEPTLAPTGPREPVLFVGQPQYFRSAWHDATLAGWGLAVPLPMPATETLRALPTLAERSGARTCVVFQPELLAAEPDAFAALRSLGVRLVGYSTEPVPLPGRPAHWDQVRRLDTLRRAAAVVWDLVVHFDPAAVATVRAEGFAPVVAHPLPVSAALFHPEDAAPEWDACFLGWSTPHREALLHPLKCRYRTLHVAHGAFDEEARRLMNRSRLVVNLHAHDYPSFENRCVQALFCGRPLVSEPLSNDLLAPGADYLVARTPDELLGHAAAILDGAAPRPTFDRTRFLAAALREVLA